MPELEIPGSAQPRVSPELMVGAASPLWSYYGALAAGGVAYWWLTRSWAVTNLEAMFSLAARVSEPVLEPIVEAAEVTAEVVADEPVTLVEAAEEAAAEAAPPTIEAVPEPPAVAEPPAAPVAHVAPEAPVDVGTTTDPVGKARLRRSGPSEPQG
jgi:hypothetical protein